MQAITTVVGSFKVAHYPTIGLDIAKSVFQVHGVDADGRVARSAGPAKTRRGDGPATSDLSKGRPQATDDSL